MDYFCIFLTFAVPLRHILQYTHYPWLGSHKFRYLWMCRFWSKVTSGKDTCQHNHRKSQKIHLHVFTYVSTYFPSLPYDSWDLYFCYCCIFLLRLPLSVHLVLNQGKYISEIFWLGGSGRIMWNLMPFWHEIYFFPREKFDVSKRFLAFFSPSYSMNKMSKLK